MIPLCTPRTQDGHEFVLFEDIVKCHGKRLAERWNIRYADGTGPALWIRDDAGNSIRREVIPYAKYEEIFLSLDPEPSFTCPRCNRTSHNPYDTLNKYCGNCHDFTGQ